MCPQSSEHANCYELFGDCKMRVREKWHFGYFFIETIHIRAVAYLQSCVGTAVGSCWQCAHGAPVGARQTLLNSRKRHLLFLESGLAGQSWFSCSPHYFPMVPESSPSPLWYFYLSILASSEFTGTKTSVMKWEKAVPWFKSQFHHLLAACLGQASSAPQCLDCELEQDLHNSPGHWTSWKPWPFLWSCSFPHLPSPSFIWFLVSGLHWTAVAMVTNDPTLF